MNMLKRTLAMMLVLCMLFTMAPITAFAEDTTDPAGTAASAAEQSAADEVPEDNETEDDVTKDDVTKDDVTKDDVTKDDVTKDDVTKDDVTKDDVTKDDVTKDDVTKDDVTKDDVIKDDVTKDDVTKDDVTKDDVTKDDVTKDDVTKDDVTKDDEDAEVTDPTEDPYGIDLTALEPEEYDFQYRILHLDCGRKYFTVDWIKALINEMSDAGYNQLQLAFGNDGMRFLLDEMSVTANGTTYSSEAVKAGIHQGNKNYYDAGDKNELTQSEMTEIIAYARSKGIDIVPHVNMPGHMDAIVDAIEYVGISDAHFTGWTTSERSLNLNNDAAVSFTKALLQKYVTYFKSQGCSFFHIGADEYGNDAYGNSMGFPSMGSSLYTKFASFVNDCAAIVKNAGMTPRAWNDGISYGEYTDSFDPDIQVTYWSDGWNGYNVASAEALRSNGHAMINTHSSYYFILTGNGITNPSSNGFSNTSFMGSTISDPIGSMFCIWCDVPGSATEQQVAEAARITLRKMAAAMQGTSKYSTEVVSGGFNADGTIAESCTQETVKNEATKVEVTGCGLTRVDVTEAAATQIPTIADTAAVLAWDITPYAGEEKYVGAATVKLPVPADWNTSLVKGFYVENGAAVTVEGTYADGFYTFKMPHFSVGGVMLLDASTPSYNEEINLEVGGTHQIVIKNVDYDGAYATDPTGIATVVAEHEEKEGTGSVTPVTAVTAGNSYYIIDSDDKYLSATANWVDTIDEAVAWTAEKDSWGYVSLKHNGAYLAFDEDINRWTTTTQATDGRTEWLTYDNQASKWFGTTSFSLFTLAEASGSVAINQSTITFTGIAPGTTYATVGDTTYKIVVTGKVEITIKYQTEDGTVIKTETVTVADNATTYTVSNFNHNGKYYTVADTALPIDPKNTITYPVTVTEVEEDLSTVTPLTIEFWQTNRQAVATKGGTDNTVSVKAADAYSENGIALTTVVPATTYVKGGASSDPSLSYWRSRLLDRATNEQTGADGDDETLNGNGFTKVRYWNGRWEVYTENGNWVAETSEDKQITSENYQLIAYYMNNLNMADEVWVGTSDWGKKGNGEFGNTYLGSPNVSLAFQVIYEGGTPTPAGTGLELAPYTYFVDAWSNRGVGTVALKQTGDYQIWKVTAETGEHSVTHNGNNNPITVNGFTWDGNETTVWEDKNNPVEQYTIQNPSTNPKTEGYYDNLRWNEDNESILIRIYVKAVETEDSLKVVYYDEKFGAVLEEFNISVESGHNFNDNIVLANTTTPATLPAFEGNADRKDANGYGIVNTVPKTQNFETNLANVAITNNRYSADLYEYTGSVISEDGKTITHYYSINQTALSPNYVADFGLPITFPLSDVVRNNIETVKSVTVNPDTLYGTLSYDSGAQQFVYTPTQVLPTIDVLTINITFDGTGTVTTNVGVTPATSVYYEENFLTYGANWSAPTAANRTQATEVLGDQTAQAGRTRYNYGYDPAYVWDDRGSNGTSVSTSTNGATASFTFTGTGFALYANCNDGTGYVTLTREGSTKKMYMMDTGLNYDELGVDMPGLSDDETTGDVDEAKPTGTFYNIPVITEKNLPYGEYKVTIYKTNNDGQELVVDGFRVYEPIDESGKTPEESFYYNDKEDKPEFYELRDVVLKSIGASGVNSSQVYKDLGDGVYSDTEGKVGLITDPSVTYANSAILNDLLNNGPKNEIYLFKDQTLTFKVNTDRAMQIGLKAPNGATTYDLTCDNGGSQIAGANMKSSVDMFYHVGNPTGTTQVFTVNVTNRGDKALAITDLKVCDDPNFSFVPLNEADIAAILHEETEPEAPTYTMVELKGTDVFIDGTVFDYTGEAIEPAITVNVNGTQLVEGRDYTVTYTNNVQPGTATVTVRGIATASETLGYTGEVSIDYTINAPAEPEVPEETTRPTRPGKPEKPDNGNKPGNNKPTEPSKPGNGNNKPGNGNGNSGKPSADKNEKQKDAKLKITFVNLKGKKVASATLTKTGTANQRCVFSADEITANAPARRYAVWFFPVIIPYGSTSSIVVPVF